jgi:hypothetical protein
VDFGFHLRKDVATGLCTIHRPSSTLFHFDFALDYTRSKSFAGQKDSSKEATLYTLSFFSPNTAIAIDNKDGGRCSEAVTSLTQRVCYIPRLPSSNPLSSQHHSNPLPASSSRALTLISPSLAVATRIKSTKSSPASAPNFLHAP